MFWGMCKFVFVRDYSNSVFLLALKFWGRRQRGPIKSVLLVMVGCLVGWLVTQFSQKRL